MNPEGVLPSRFAVRKWALYYTAALQPSTVLEDLAAGHATIEQVETLKALHQDVYDDVRGECVNLIQSGAKPSVSQRARMSMLFDLGAVDPVFSPSVGLLADQARRAEGEKQGRAQQGGKGASVKASKAFDAPERTLESVS
jgi:hypothetical protein